MNTTTDTSADAGTNAPASTYPNATATLAAAPAVRTLGIVSLVLGIASIISGFQFIMGIAAIVLGVLALRQEPLSKNFAIAGIVTGAVSGIGIFWGLAGLAGFAFLLPFAPLFAGDMF